MPEHWKHRRHFGQLSGGIAAVVAHDSINIHVACDAHSFSIAEFTFTT